MEKEASSWEGGSRCCTICSGQGSTVVTGGCQARCEGSSRATGPSSSRAESPCSGSGDEATTWQ